MLRINDLHHFLSKAKAGQIRGCGISFLAILLTEPIIVLGVVERTIKHEIPKIL